MISGTFYYENYYPPQNYPILSGGIEYHPSHTYQVPQNREKIYYRCEHCGAKYLLPEIRGTILIRLQCSGCGGNLKETDE